jgi:hypothetical protein
MDGGKGRTKITAGLDLGDRYSYPCASSTQRRRGNRGRSALRTTPEALRRRFASEQPPMRIAIESGIDSPWVNRLLKECGHEVLATYFRYQLTLI